jgi:hypothetical protein
LRGCEFTDQEAFLDAIEDILKGIENMIFENVFLSWVERLRQCGSTAGEYMEETKFLRDLDFSAVVSS